MSDFLTSEILFNAGAAASVAMLSAAAKVLMDGLQAKRASKRVLDAEQRAFGRTPEEIAASTQRIIESQDHIERRAQELAALVEAAQRTIQLGTLFDLYNKQIEKYQTETQARAGWSFIFAIFSMMAGLAFVVWGGVQILSSKSTGSTLGTAAVSGIGAALSGFITKTFLDVHKLSLSQLNRYFKQPVVNSHILTAQRLADGLEGQEPKALAYRDLIASVISLIRDEDLEVMPSPLKTLPAAVAVRKRAVPPKKDRA